MSGSRGSGLSGAIGAEGGATGGCGGCSTTTVFFFFGEPLLLFVAATQGMASEAKQPMASTRARDRRGKPGIMWNSYMTETPAHFQRGFGAAIVVGNT
jgi:hypothetical protein